MSRFLPLSDRALQAGEADLLGRGLFVRNLAAILCHAPKDDSVVFALYGKWGEGKTSTLALLDKEFEDLHQNHESIPIRIHFNPWVFSGREHLFRAFFADIGTAIGKSGIENAEDTAKKWKSVGAYTELAGNAISGVNDVLNLFGLAIPGATAMQGAAKAISKNASTAAAAHENTSGKTLAELRSDLANTLRTLDTPLLVILDDLDRLPPAELVEIFQLLKSTVDLPNVHYLLLCDQGNIERNLEKHGLRRDYLEKIVQFGATLPAVPDSRLRDLLIIQLKAAFHQFARDDKRFDDSLWERIGRGELPRAFSTLRDLKRYVGELRLVLPAFCSNSCFELNPEQFLLLQALRLFCPQVVDLLRSHRHLFLPRNESIFFLKKEREKRILERKELVEKTIPKSLKAMGLSRFEPLARDLLSHHGIDWAVSALAFEQRSITTRLWFDAYFTLEMPQLYVSVADINMLHKLVDGPQEPLSKFMNGLVGKEGTEAVIRCLDLQFGVIAWGTPLIIALLSSGHAGKCQEHANAMADPVFEFFAKWLRKLPPEKREQEVLDVVSRSRNHRLFSLILCQMDEWDHDFHYVVSNLLPFRDSLGKATAVLIEESALDQLQLLGGGFWHSQEAWARWGSKAALTKWIRETTKEGKVFKEYLLALGEYRTFHDEADQEKEQFWLNSSRLAYYPDLREGAKKCREELAVTGDPRDKLLFEGALLSFQRAMPYRQGESFFRKKHPELLNVRFRIKGAASLAFESMAIVTAGNLARTDSSPDQTPQLQVNIETQCGPSLPVGIVAADGKTSHRGFLIGTDMEAAIELGKRYGQVAIFMIYGLDRVEIVSCEGRGHYRLGRMRNLAVA